MSMALVTLDQAKDALGIPASDTSKDGLVGREIAQISAAINTYCDRVFVKQGYQDQFRAVSEWRLPGQPLTLRNFPICVGEDQLPLVAVTESGTAVGVTDMEVYLELGHVFKLGGSGIAGWTDSMIVVDYVAGYEVIPEDVQAAALEWLGARWISRGRDPALRSMSIPDVISETYWQSNEVSTTTSTSSIPAGTRDLLMFYRPVVFA